MRQHYALLSEYDGSCFHGWQEQANAKTVQEEIRKAWKDISDEDCHFRGSSRTDAGVSSFGHVCDFYSQTKIPWQKIPRVLNGRLEDGLVIRDIARVPAKFDARYDSVGKLYVYRLYCDEHRSAIYRNLTSHCPQKPNITLMQDLAKDLEGVHDFTAFMDQGSVVRRTVRSIDRIEVLADPNQPIISIFCLGRGFLYHQVRILAGTLYYVGLGKLTKEKVFQAMANQDRRPLGKTMPAAGLCLERVFYPDPIFNQDGEADYQLLCKVDSHRLLDIVSGKRVKLLNKI